ncbi:TonB-dependent receptor [Aquimarina sp. 2304DJ70-9]|uniref:TonB-dependent receptor n=1 Tax=Aquimarina penaris TaxID=3231044 RepID=UPI0034633FA7
MFRLYVMVLLFSFGLTTIATAQEVSGTVLDDQSQPLPGVSVVIKGTETGTVTDFDGKYTIEADSGQILVFSYVGFEKQEIVVSGPTLDVTLQSGVSLDEVILVGTRNVNRTVTETPVPIDILDIKELATATPQVNLNQILNYVAPSFSSNTQTISDGTDHIDPASLRGLGPDQVLVLVNGKRRHTTSLVNVNGTFGRGSVGTDLNAIPAASIQRIEVLRDGASAQYGSDAIAGVINIVLNKSVNELNLSITSGANVSRNAEEQTGGIDGETINVAASYGLALGEKGGFINFSGDFDYRDYYSRMKEWEGNIFHGQNAIERVAIESGVTDISNLTPAQVRSFGSQVTYFDQSLRDNILNAASLDAIYGVNAGSASVAGFLSELTFNDNGGVTGIRPLDFTDQELAARGQSRSDYNMRVGQSELRGGRFFANFSLPLDDNDTELYSFAGISSRRGNSAGFYRLPNQERTYTPAYINGFLPEINSKINDQSIAIGIKGKIGEWSVDFSNTYGKNSFLYTISNTSNASLLNATPTTFDAGGFSFLQNTTNLDITKFYEDIFSGFNVAFGAEHRLENYEIVAGEEESYTQYDPSGRPVGPVTIFDALGNPINTIVTEAPEDVFGRTRPGGSQVFPGFSPANELSRNRTSIAGYLDFEADFTEKFLVSFATRFEDYSDFGSTINFKVATRYKVTDDINIRAAGNTGFRAPSLHQLNFNSTSTIFDNFGNPQEVGTFANDSRAANLLGIPQLKEETSRSISIGTTAKIPGLNLSITVDGYFVAIDDRVVFTGQFRGPGTGTELDNLLAQANATRAAFFANAIDTESKGLDVVITHKTGIGANMELKSDLAATFSQTRKVGDIQASEVLEAAGLIDTYFPEDSRVYLEEAVPRTKINLSNSLTTNKFNVFLRNVYFGEVTEATTTIENQQVFGAKVVTDLSFGYKATENFTITIGANNLFDIYPDRAEEEFGNRSSGRFDWSRRSQQFGIGGRFLFARLSVVLK